MRRPQRVLTGIFLRERESAAMRRVCSRIKVAPTSKELHCSHLCGSQSNRVCSANPATRGDFCGRMAIKRARCSRPTWRPQISSAVIVARPVQIVNSAQVLLFGLVAYHAGRGDIGRPVSSPMAVS